MNAAGVDAAFDRLAQAHELGLSSPQMDVGAMAARAFVSGDTAETDLAVRGQRDAHRALLDPSQSARLADGSLDWRAHDNTRAALTTIDIARNLFQQELKGVARAGNLETLGREIKARVKASAERSATLAFSMFGAQLGSNTGLDVAMETMLPAFADVITNNDTDALPLMDILALVATQSGMQNFNAVIGALERGNAEATTDRISKGRGAAEQRLAMASALNVISVQLDLLSAERVVSGEIEIDMAGTTVQVLPPDKIADFAKGLDQVKLNRLRNKVVAASAALDATDDLNSHSTKLRVADYLDDMFETIAGVEAFTQQRIKAEEIDPIMQEVFRRHPQFRDALEDESNILRRALPALGQFSPSGATEVANLSTEEFGGAFGGGQ